MGIAALGKVLLRVSIYPVYHNTFFFKKFEENLPRGQNGRKCRHRKREGEVRTEDGGVGGQFKATGSKVRF